MFGYIGAHFDVMVLVAFGLFAAVLGYQAAAEGLRR